MRLTGHRDPGASPAGLGLDLSRRCGGRWVRDGIAWWGRWGRLVVLREDAGVRRGCARVGGLRLRSFGLSPASERCGLGKGYKDRKTLKSLCYLLSTSS